MATVSMESRLTENEPLANATASTERGPLLSNSSAKDFKPSKVKKSSSQKSSKLGGKEKRGKLSKALTLPSGACSPPTRASEADARRLRPAQIVPRTSQYEKNPLLQERSSSGLSELEEFLLANTPAAKAIQAPAAQVITRDGGVPSPPKLQLQPRGAQLERHPLLIKTSSGKSELEQLLLEKEKEIEQREKKAKKTLEKDAKPLVGIEVPPLKRLFVKKGVSVEKAKSFEKTACLEKVKSIDLSQNVSRARSLEEESSLEKVTKRVKLGKIKKSMDRTQSNPLASRSGAMTNIGGLDSSISPSSSKAMPCARTAEMENTSGTHESCSSGVLIGNGSAMSPSLMEAGDKTTPQKRQKLLDLALKPNLEWREEAQQFVVTVQSPVSPFEERPDNLLIMYAPRTERNNVASMASAKEDSCCSLQEGSSSSTLTPVPPFEKQKKFVHPSVIDSDPDSVGMVCMDELEPIDFGVSSAEPSPQRLPGKKTLIESSDSTEKELLIDVPVEAEKEAEPISCSSAQLKSSSAATVSMEKPEKEEENEKEEEADEETKEEAEEANHRVPVEAMSVDEWKRKLSLKRASLGQLEPRTEQYIQHPLLEERDEEGKTAIDKLLQEKEQELLDREREAAVLAAEDRDAADLDVDADPMQTRASIRRVHFEKSDGSAAAPEIEELGKVDIEADAASSNSSRSNGSKKKGFKGSKNTKNKDNAPEEERLLDADGEESDKDVRKDGGNKKCCCIS